MFIVHVMSYLMMCCPLGVMATVLALPGPNPSHASARSEPGRHAHRDATPPLSSRWSNSLPPSRAPAVMTVSHPPSTSEPTALKTCRNPRNCVVDAPDADDPALRPIPFRAPIEQVMRTMTAAIAGEPRMRMVVAGRRYLRAEARSALFRFVDDVELLADENAGLIHFRSASRTGRRDFGVNGRRMRRITALIRQGLGDLTTPAP